MMRRLSNGAHMRVNASPEVFCFGRPRTLRLIRGSATVASYIGMSSRGCSDIGATGARSPTPSYIVLRSLASCNDTSAASRLALKITIASASAISLSVFRSRSARRSWVSRGNSMLGAFSMLDTIALGAYKRKHDDSHAVRQGASRPSPQAEAVFQGLHSPADRPTAYRSTAAQGECR